MLSDAHRRIAPFASKVTMSLQGPQPTSPMSPGSDTVPPPQPHFLARATCRGLQLSRSAEIPPLLSSHKTFQLPSLEIRRSTFPLRLPSCHGPRGKCSEIHLNPRSRKSLFPEQQNDFIIGKVQPGTMPKALPKPCANNHTLTASKPLSLADSRAGQSNADFNWKHQLCPRHGQHQALRVSGAPHPPLCSPAPASGAPSRFLPCSGAVHGGSSPPARPWEPKLLCTHVGASKTSPGFNTESHKCFSLAEPAFSQESKF